MLSIRHSLSDLGTRFIRGRDSLRGESGRQAMVAVGLQTLGWTIEDYRVKSRGGVDESGTKWQPVSRISIAGRLLKRKIGEPVRRLLRRGPHNWKRNAAIIARAAFDPRWFPEFYAAVSREHAQHVVGVDTGRLVNSIAFGVPNAPRPGPIQHASQAPAKAIFNVTEKSVELGTRQSYAGWFARQRPIFPKGFLSQRRKQALAAIYVRTARAVIGGK